MTTNEITTPTFDKKVRRDRVTKDYVATVNDEVIGYRDTYQQAQSLCDELVYEMLRRASHADISDLTPEDAEVALEVVTALADEEAATDSAEVVTVEAEANAQQVDVVPVFSYNIGGIEFTVGTDGALTVYAARRDEPAYGLCPDDTYALYLFLTKLPHVGPLLERAHMDRQHFLYGDMETKKNSEGFDAAPSIVAHLAKARREKETVAANVA